MTDFVIKAMGRTVLLSDSRRDSIMGVTPNTRLFSDKNNNCNGETVVLTQQQFRSVLNTTHLQDGASENAGLL